MQKSKALQLALVLTTAVLATACNKRDDVPPPGAGTTSPAPADSTMGTTPGATGTTSGTTGTTDGTSGTTGTSGTGSTGTGTSGTGTTDGTSGTTGTSGTSGTTGGAASAPMDSSTVPPAGGASAP